MRNKENQINQIRIKMMNIQSKKKELQVLESYGLETKIKTFAFSKLNKED